MGEMEEPSAIIYVPENVKSYSNSSYTAFLNENSFALRLPGSKQEGSGGLLKGPRRVIRLCMFGLILPTLLIIIPLYVRLILYPPGHYPMMPTDQRVLSRHVSNLWCKGQYVQMNGSFTTYQTTEAVTLKGGRKRHVMLHNTILKDDVKEYWGFYLLKGSTVSISTCSSLDGAQLMILRGTENLKRCAWIGQEDSMEEEDENDETVFGTITKNDRSMSLMEIEESTVIKDSPDEESVADKDNNEKRPEDEDDILQSETLSDFITLDDDSDERRQNLQDLIQKALKMSKSKKEILRILHSVGRGGRKPLPKNIRQLMGITSDEVNASPEASVQSPKRKKPKQKIGKKAGKRLISRTNSQSRLTRAVFEDVDEYENGAFERYDENDDNDNQKRGVVQHVFYPEGLRFERGKFNQTNYGDRSNEEDHSSYSSSEEALASCDGVIMTLPLVPYKSCSYRWTEMNKVKYDIPITGTYYFVYSSENEIDSNTIYLNMTFEKVVYDTNRSQLICSNSSDCSVPISFWSHEEVVVEVPLEDTWENSYTLDTYCEPRVAVYLIFMLLVPVLILFCAFH